ncbi:MAG: F0F1 ATP synthase subunit delta [Helicobacteraceae bacterium]|jgi:F-type H+-transporting ATPase subunit delta|nr:F0F1 ATP synthase subunit delta [Helicobacteraceae bacterium]
MNDKAAAKRYALALISVLSAEEMERCANILNNVSLLFENKKFVEITKSPLIDARKKSDLIASCIKEKPIKLLNFFMLLVEKNRLGALPYIAKEVQSAIAVKKGVYNGIIYSQKPLEKSQLTELEGALSKRLGAAIKLMQDSKSYGGIKVTVEDLGVEADFSKAQIKTQILGHILRGL